MNEAATDSRRLPTLDLLRFVAATSVLLFHYTFRGAVRHTYIDIQYPEIDAWTRYGFFGVDLFFLISGFVILMTVQASAGKPSRFVASRVSRIYPVFWVAATVVFLAMWDQPAPLGVSFRDYMLNLTMTPNWFGARFVDGAYWTLVVELRFYIGVLLYLVVLQRCIAIDTMLALWLALIACTLGFADAPEWLRDIALNEFGALFVSGCLFFRAWHAGWTPWRLVMLIVAYACAMVSVYRQIPIIPKEYAEQIAPVTVLVVNSLIFGVFAVLTSTPHLLRRGGRIAITLGLLTYPLYLVHQKIGYVLINAIEPITGRWLCLLLVSLVVACLALGLHYGVERPYNRRLRGWLEPKLRWLDRAAGMAAARSAGETSSP